MTIPTRPAPDADPSPIEEPGTHPDEPKEPGVAPGPEDPEKVREDEEEDAEERD